MFNQYNQFKWLLFGKKSLWHHDSRNSIENCTFRFSIDFQTLLSSEVVAQYNFSQKWIRWENWMQNCFLWPHLNSVYIAINYLSFIFFFWIIYLPTINAIVFFKFKCKQLLKYAKENNDQYGILVFHPWYLLRNQKKMEKNYCLQDIILEKEGATTGVLLPVCLWWGKQTAGFFQTPVALSGFLVYGQIWCSSYPEKYTCNGHSHLQCNFKLQFIPICHRSWNQRVLFLFFLLI